MSAKNQRRSLNDRFLRSLISKPPPRRVTITDPGRPGLELRAGPGQLAWSFRYRVPGGSFRRLDLGSYPATPLADVEEERQRLRQLVARGKDPAEPIRERKEALTVADLVDRYLEHVRARRRPRYAAEVARALRADLLPQVGTQPAQELDRSTIRRVLRRVEERGAGVAANRLQAYVSAMISWGMDHEDLLAGVMEINPCLGLKKLHAERPRDRILDWAEIRSLWKVLERYDCAAARAHQLALLVGQRRGDILGAAEAEIDWATGWWTIPGARYKGRRDHRVYLTPEARAIARATAENGRLFPGRGAESSLLRVDRWTYRFADEAGTGPFTFHDLRRTVASRLRPLGVSAEVRAAILGHARHDVTERHYEHDPLAYDADKVRAMEAWTYSLLQVVA